MNSIMTKALEPIAELIAEVGVPRFNELLDKQEEGVKAFEEKWGIKVPAGQRMRDPEAQENVRKLIRGETVRKAGKIERRQAQIRLEEAVADAVKKLKPAKVVSKPKTGQDNVDLSKFKEVMP